MKLKAAVQHNTWSGHGEGGSTVNVTITGWAKDKDVYNSTDADVERAKDAARWINYLLKIHDRPE